MTANISKLPTHQESDINTLRGDVRILELRLRIHTDKNFVLMGDKYGLELKNSDLKSDNQGLNNDLYNLRELHTKVCEDLHGTTLESGRLYSEVVKLREMVLSCECNDACKSYKHGYFSDDIDNTDGASV